MMHCWTRSETLHSLPGRSAEQATKAWASFLHACHDDKCDERDLILSYQEMARFVVHASARELEEWVGGETNKLNGSDLNRFILLCKLLTLLTYDPEKEKLLESKIAKVDLAAPVEPLMTWKTSQYKSENYTKKFRISDAGPTDAFNQIAQSGYA